MQLCKKLRTLENNFGISFFFSLIFTEVCLFIDLEHIFFYRNWLNHGIKEITSLFNTWSSLTHKTLGIASLLLAERRKGMTKLHSTSNFRDTHLKGRRQPLKYIQQTYLEFHWYFSPERSGNPAHTLIKNYK